jgi:hypothetical protein
VLAAGKFNYHERAFIIAIFAPEGMFCKFAGAEIPGSDDTFPDGIGYYELA